MCEPRRLTTVPASTVCYGDTFTYFFALIATAQKKYMDEECEEE
jgi:hypothetical protein